MKYTQEEFVNIVTPYIHGLSVDLSLGPKDASSLRDLSRLCANRVTRGLDWGILGGRLNLAIIRSKAGKTFSASTKLLKLYLQNEYYNFVLENAEVLDAIPNEANSDNRQAISIGVLEKTYLLKYNLCGNCKNDCPECEKFYVGETPEQMYMRIATFLCMPNIQMIRRTYEYLSSGKYSHATPTMYHAGTLRPQMASCFVLSVQDSLWSIEDHWMYVGEVSRNSGGIGLDVSNIRHSFIGNAGKSDGVPALLKPFEAILHYVDQSKKRQGSAAIFLSIWHIDIEDFIELKVPVGNESDNTKCTELFYSVWVQDIFMRRAKEDADWTLFCPKRCPGLTEVWGKEFEELYLKYEKEGRGLKKVKAQKLLQQIYAAQCKVGVPYICMADRFNESNMQSNIGLIRSSNLCVAPDTLLLTDGGWEKISDLWGVRVNVWNGVEWSETVVKKTGSNQTLYRITFSNGATLDCTGYHKFHIQDEGVLPTIQLKPGMKLIDCQFPILVTAGKEISELVPINDTLQYKLEWIQTIINSTGRISKGNNCNIWSNKKEILRDIQLMLQTIGCNPFIYKTKRGWRLFITSKELFILGLTDMDNVRFNTPYKTVSVQSIKQLPGVSDTYCFKEDIKGTAVFNGVITGQCSEIALHTSEKEIASCNLASICLASFVKDKVFDYEELAKVVRFTVRIINNVIDRNYYPERIPQIKETNLRNRPLGIGIQGLANTFAKMEVLFDSQEAFDINNKIIQTMYYAAVDESANMAREFGPYPAFPGSPYSMGKLHPDLWKAPNGDTAKFLPEFDWEGLRTKVKGGIYNSTLLSLMPTASSSIIAGQEPCFEPFNFIVGSKTLISGQYTQVCREFVQDLEKLGVWSEEICNQILTNDLGSTAGLQVPDKIKDNSLKVARWNFLMDKYRTAYEIGPKASILQAIARTPFVCQSQSINWFVPEPSWKKFSKCLFESWERGCKTAIYYNRGKSSAKARSVANCTSCTV